MRRPLRKGKAKSIVEGSKDAALLAVEVYNKPRTTFRTQGFVALMIIAWTRLFHAFFHRTIGDTYHYKKKGRFVIVEGERKSWELSTCIDEYGNLPRAMAENLKFFIALRNKIEHRHISRFELDKVLFGECQALLYNYERQLVDWFGEEHALNESLAFSLQFSKLRTEAQKAANREVLSRDAQDLHKFISTYRENLPEGVYASQEFSIKLLILPKVTNTNRHDLAVEFVRYEDLNDEERSEYDRLVTLVKDKRVVQLAANVGRLKPSDVVQQVSELASTKINSYDHVCFWSVFRVRPRGQDVASGALYAFDTNVDYCHYSEPHDDYVYTQDWVRFIVRVLDEGLLTVRDVREKYKNEETLEVKDFGG